MSSSIYLSTDELKQALVSVANNHIREVRVQSLELQVKSTGADEGETYLEIEMILESNGRAEGVLDWVKRSVIHPAINGRHVVCVAITEVSPGVLHLRIWSETFVLGALQWLAKALPKPENPDLIERTSDFSSVKINLDKIFLPLPGEPSPVALPDLFHLQRFGFCPGSPGAVEIEFEMMSSTPQ